MTSPAIRPPFPQVWDASMLAAFRSCPTKFRREYMEHWKPKGQSVHLHAGAAYAHGLEVARRAFYIDSAPADEAVARGMDALLRAYGDFECPQDSAKSALRTAGALEYYFTQYPLATDAAVPALLGDRRGIEFSFATNLPYDHPDGDPLIYCGRADMIVDFAGSRYILDDKTTSSLGASWSRQWDMRSQFTGYCWASAEHKIEVAGVLVRGVSILKTKYDTQQAITYRPKFMVDRWLEQVVRDISRAESMWQSGYYDYNLDHACAEYGGCTFLQCCTSPDEKPWLTTYFERRVWDPLTRTETPINDEEMPA